MLAEFDPYKWDLPLFILGCLFFVGLYYWRRKKMREEVLASLDQFPTNVDNVTITFWHDEHLKPTPAEVSLVDKVFKTAQLAWPEYAKRLDDEKYNVWIVRSPEQRVGWRHYGGIMWKDIPLHGRIPATDPASGYGGLSESKSGGGTVWIATFFPNRPAEKLLTHEITHCITGIHNDPTGKHPPEFEALEKRLLEELAKVE
jgi:hypothetical protein